MTADPHSAEMAGTVAAVAPDILELVDAFAEKEIRGRWQRPEVPLKTTECAEIAKAAIAAELLPVNGEVGLGLWELVDEPGGLQLHLATLQTLAGASAGVALHIHQLALGRLIARTIGLENGRLVLPLLQGRNGLARYSLGHLLADATLVDDDLGNLADYFPTPGSGCLATAADGWDYLAYPSWDGTALRWQAEPADDSRREKLPDGHGLNETATWETTLATEPLFTSITLDGKASRELLLKILGINHLALLAISIGNARNALQRARNYSCERRQGGKAISQHAAVQLLLAEAEANIDIADTCVGAYTKAPACSSSMATVARLRSRLQPMLSEAVSNCLQCFGGYGYMQDFVVEKLLRDANHLKQIFGTPTQLRLFATAIDGCDGVNHE